MDSAALQAWFRTPLGQLVAAAEREAVQALLAECRPGFVVQLGAMGDSEPAPVAGAVKRWLVDCDDSVSPGVKAWHDDLPFVSGTVDTLVLVHRLEFEDDPHRVLREAERVLAPEGHLLVLAFNPLSLWGLGRIAGPLRGGTPPWCGQYYTGLRLRDWCRLLGLEHRQHQRLFFRPPVQRGGVQKRLEVMERLGQRCWPVFGGVYAQLSRKRVARAIPMGALVRRREALVAGEPAAAQASRCACLIEHGTRANENDRDLQRRRLSRQPRPGRMGRVVALERQGEDPPRRRAGDHQQPHGAHRRHPRA